LEARKPERDEELTEAFQKHRDAQLLLATAQAVLREERRATERAMKKWAKMSPDEMLWDIVSIQCRSAAILWGFVAIAFLALAFLAFWLPNSIPLQ